jgi:preprotein translocase subunit SecE
MFLSTSGESWWRTPSFWWTGNCSSQSTFFKLKNLAVKCGYLATKVTWPNSFRSGESWWRTSSFWWTGNCSSQSTFFKLKNLAVKCGYLATKVTWPNSFRSLSLGTYEVPGVCWAVELHNDCFRADKKRQTLSCDTCHFTFMKGHSMHR